ncbi:hypothetical protein HYV49_01155 [Candidatus Pacearchaeota archaeon]|nr:hypothetical protein [Candidatus Pacearchaeota archaeon]
MQLLKIVARWKSVGVNVVNKQIYALDCFQFSDDTYAYGYGTETDEEIIKGNRDKKRFTLDELNRTWHDTPMAKCARREIAPTYEKKIICDCGGDKLKLPHSVWCSKFIPKLD